MSTIPTISKNKPVPYTVVGGTRQGSTPPSRLTILLLNRGGRFYREELLAEISALEFAEIIYIEGPDLSYDIEPLSRRFPAVRFILLKNKVTAGEKINLGFSESLSPALLVMWSDLALRHHAVSSRLLDKILESRVLCTVPRIANQKKEVIPTIQVPGYIRRKLKVIPWCATKEGCHSLYPFDFCGIYNREKFDCLGGFDPHIDNPFWQKMDFGCRAYLWGEKILFHPALELNYRMEEATEDSTPDSSYKRFYLKNMAVKHHKGVGCLKGYKFFNYLWHADTGPVQSLKDFLRLKAWVREHAACFKLDLKTIVNLWEPPGT